jgi:hypothetical protein
MNRRRSAGGAVAAVRRHCRQSGVGMSQNLKGHGGTNDKEGKTMKVSELIEILRQQPPDMRVVVNGYEGGLCDVFRVRQLPILVNRHVESWVLGPHEECSENAKDETALLLPRQDA